MKPYLAILSSTDTAFFVPAFLKKKTKEENLPH